LLVCTGYALPEGSVEWLGWVMWPEHILCQCVPGMHFLKAVWHDFLEAIFQGINKCGQIVSLTTKNCTQVTWLHAHSHRCNYSTPPEMWMWLRNECVHPIEKIGSCKHEKETEKTMKKHVQNWIKTCQIVTCVMLTKCWDVAPPKCHLIQFRALSGPGTCARLRSDVSR
jgi:hypothetical protein